MKHFLQKMWLMALMLLVSVGAAWAQKTYTKVTDASTLKAGDVIILACDDKGTYAGAMGENSYFASVDAKEKAIEITLGGSASGWTLTTSEGVIGTSSAKKLLKDQGTNTWKITISDGDASIVSTSSAYGTIYFNASSPRFLNYTSAQTKIQIYKVAGNASTTPSEPTWSTTPTSVSVAAGKTASLSYNTNYNGQLYIGSMDEEVATVTTNGKTVTVTGVKEGETTIYFSGNATSSMKALYQTVPVVVTAASDGGNTEVTGGTYTLTDLANLSATDEVLVIWTPQAGGAYALSNDKGTTAAPTAVSVAINNKSITTDAENIVWNVDYNSTDKTFTLYPAGTTDKWLYATNTNNGVRVGTNTNKTFNITNDYLFHIGTSRYLGVYNNADIRCYTSSGGNIANQTVAFYVKTANGGGDTGGGDTGGGGDTPDFTGFIKNANIDVALNGEQYDISADLNIPKGYDKDPYAIRTTIDGQSQKDGEFACAYPWITFLKVGTYTVHVACVNGSQVLAEGNITVKVYDPNGEVVDPEQPEQNVFASLAELVAAGAPTSTAKTVTVTLTDEPIERIFVTKSGNRSGIYLKSGEQEVEIYYPTTAVPEAWLPGGTVSGTITCPWMLFGTTWELAPEKETWSWDKLEYKAPANVPQYAVTYTAPEHGKLVVKNGDVEIESGAKVDANTEVTLDITPDSGYEFDKWEVIADDKVIFTCSSTRRDWTVTDDVEFKVYFREAFVEPTGDKATWNLTDDETVDASDAHLLWRNNVAMMETKRADGATAANNYYPGSEGKEYNSTRFYKNNDLVITPASGITITAVVVDCTTTNDTYTDNLVNSTWTNATVKKYGTKVVLTPTNGTQAISAVIGGTTGSTAVTVYYTGTSQGWPEATMYAVNVDEELEGGSISVSVATAEAGAIITLTATPDDGYEFTAWSVTMVDGGTAVEVKDNKFTMPEGNVNVSATFMSSEHTIVCKDVTWTQGKDDKGVTQTLTGTAKPYTVFCDKTSSGSTPPAYANENDVRVYAKGTITITSETPFTSVVFNLSAQGLKRLAPISASCGAVSTQAAGDEIVTWTSEQAVKSVTFTVGDKANYGSDGETKAGQLCFTSIDIVAGEAPATVGDLVKLIKTLIDGGEVTIDEINTIVDSILGK